MFKRISLDRASTAPGKSDCILHHRKRSERASFILQMTFLFQLDLIAVHSFCLKQPCTNKEHHSGHPIKISNTQSNRSFRVSFAAGTIVEVMGFLFTSRICSPPVFHCLPCGGVYSFMYGSGLSGFATGAAEGPE